MYFACEITQEMSQYKHCLERGKERGKNEKQKEEFNKESWHWSVATNVICIIVR